MPISFQFKVGSNVWEVKGYLSQPSTGGKQTNPSKMLTPSDGVFQRLLSKSLIPHTISFPTERERCSQLLINQFGTTQIIL